MDYSARMRVTKICFKTVSNALQAWGEHTVSGFCYSKYSSKSLFAWAFFRIRSFLRKAIKTGPKKLTEATKD